MVCATEAGPHGNFACGPPCSGVEKGWREEMEKTQQRLIMTLRHTIEGRTCLRQIFEGGGSGCVTPLKALSLQLPCTQLM